MKRLGDDGFPRLTRRSLVGTALSAAAACSTSGLFATAPPESGGGSDINTPDVRTLKCGDLLWPKKPGAYVPFDSTAEDDFKIQSDKWYAEKRAYIRQVRGSRDAGPEARQWATELEQMSFEEFLRRYEGDHDEDYIVKMGGQTPLYVGHVGIVDCSSGEPYVIEALGGKGVIRGSYAQWLAGRPGQLIWQARFSEGSETQRASIAAKAALYLGKPYDFWNFNLADEAGFYCSKLAWLAIRKALDIAPDDNLNPQRLFWFSPKKLMKSKHLKLLVNPGNYTIA
jgi:cell wall-associated NlpC family hydrolase